MAVRSRPARQPGVGGLQGPVLLLARSQPSLLFILARWSPPISKMEFVCLWNPAQQLSPPCSHVSPQLWGGSAAPPRKTGECFGCRSPDTPTRLVDLQCFQHFPSVRETISALILPALCIAVGTDYKTAQGWIPSQKDGPVISQGLLHAKCCPPSTGDIPVSAPLTFGDWKRKVGQETERKCERK